MQNERDDVWNTNLYHRAIRKTISEVLSQSKRYDLSQPLPERIRTLLVQLDEQSVQGLAGEPAPPRLSTAKLDSPDLVRFCFTACRLEINAIHTFI
jgi:hypothetical protein